VFLDAADELDGSVVGDHAGDSVAEGGLEIILMPSEQCHIVETHRDLGHHLRGVTRSIEFDLNALVPLVIGGHEVDVEMERELLRIFKGEREHDAQVLHGTNALVLPKVWLDGSDFVDYLEKRECVYQFLLAQCWLSPQRTMLP